MDVREVLAGGTADVLADGLLATALVLGAILLWRTGVRHGLSGRPGWRPMHAGLIVLAALGVLDLLDQFFHDLWVLGGVDMGIVLEDFVLPLGGVALLVYGIVRWAPLHGQLATARAELHQGEVERLHKMNQFKSVFLNTAAHELATPLTPIMLQLAVLEHQQGDTQAVRLLKRNFHRLETLVRDLLDATRLQSGRLAFRMQPMDLAGLMQELEATFTHPCSERGIGFRLQSDTELKVEAADELRLSQVLFNLIGNAMKFTPKGGSIDVEARRTDDEVTIHVRDTGHGLAPDELDGLFQPFQQFHRDLEGAETGTGLGLYVAQQIAQAHGGTIEAASDGRGKGSRFTLRLPVRAPAPRPDAGPAPS